MDNRIVVLMGVFFFVFVLFVGTVIFREQLVVFTRAKEDTLPSITESLILAWPLSAKADGQESVTVSIFIRSNKGAPLANKKVRLTSSLGKIKENDIPSDSGGKSTFILTSQNEGVATIEATAEEIYVLQKKVNVLFKNLK